MQPETKVRNALKDFGVVSQIRFMTSALKWQGRKLYELARSSQVVERSRPERQGVFTWNIFGAPRMGQAAPHCYSPYYLFQRHPIRTLCGDLGQHLGCGAYMSFLVRTRSRLLRVEDSLTLEEINRAISAGTMRKNS